MAHSATCSHLAPSADRVCKPLDSEEEQGPHCCHLKVENSFHRVQPWQTHREELWRFSTAGCPCSRWREGEYWLICILGLSWQQEQATLTINLKHQYILKKKKKTNGMFVFLKKCTVHCTEYLEDGAKRKPKWGRQGAWEEQIHGKVVRSWDIIIIMTVIMMINLLTVSPYVKYLFCMSHEPPYCLFLGYLFNLPNNIGR